MAEEPSERRVDPELARLRDELRASRADLRETVTSLRREARDPFGIKQRVKSHPIATAGIAAGAGLLLFKLLTRKRKSPAPADAASSTNGRPGGKLLHSLVSTAAAALAKTAIASGADWFTKRRRDRKP